jgi:histone H3/H4
VPLKAPRKPPRFSVKVRAKRAMVREVRESFKGKAVMSRPLMRRIFAELSPREMRIRPSAIEALIHASEDMLLQLYRAGGEVQRGNKHQRMTPEDWKTALRVAARMRGNTDARVSLLD